MILKINDFAPICILKIGTSINWRFTKIVRQFVAEFERCFRIVVCAEIIRIKGDYDGWHHKFNNINALSNFVVGGNVIFLGKR